MQDLLNFLKDTIDPVIEFIIFLLELLGAAVIVFASARSFWGYLRGYKDIRLKFAMAMATGLEFKFAGEILRTVIVRNMSEIAVAAAIILLRAFMTILIHWEIRTEAPGDAPPDERPAVVKRRPGWPKMNAGGDDGPAG